MASCAALLRIGIYLATTAFGRDPRYVMGCLEGVGIDLLFGLAAAAPVLGGGLVFDALAGALALLYLLATAAGAHVHAVLLSLPTREALGYLKDLRALGSSIREHAPLGEVLVEVLVPAAASLWAAARWAPRIEPALHERHRIPLAFAVVGTAALASSARTMAVQGQEYYGAIGPIVHVTKPSTNVEWLRNQPGPEVISAVEQGLATDNPGPPEDPKYPFCARSVPAPASGPTGRSALLLILESVDIRSFELAIGGVSVMPNLNRMAKDGVLFSRFFSSGNMSVYALPPLFGGIPAAPVHALLMRTPLDHVLGFPGELRRQGYDTAYMHASDLSFSHEDEFVKRVGFEHLVPMPANIPRYGWGASDGALFREVEAYIERVRAGGDRPYFVTAFTVSTHDPYELPPEYHRKSGGDTPFERFVESLRYLDGELGRFYEWYSRNELPRGTVLAVTGDHASRLPFPGDPADTTTGELEFRFRVPLILLGLTEAESDRARANAAHGVGGHHDVPATLAAALGVAPPRCHQGRNLLGADVPKARIVTSVAGDGLQFLYGHQGTRRFMLEVRGRRKIREHDYIDDPTFRRDLASSDPNTRTVKRFLSDYFDVMHYATVEDRFAPAPDTLQPSAELPRVAAAERVSRGAPPDGADGGVVAELDRALAGRPDWLELSITTNARGGLVVRRWKEPPPAEGSDLSIGHSDTTAEGPALEDVLAHLRNRAKLFLDVERPARFVDIMSTVHGVVAAVDGLPPGTAVVESSDEVMLTSIRQFSKVSVAYRIPPDPVTAGPLRFASERGFGWVSLREDRATPEAIRAAHAQGLRVVTYPTEPPQASRGDAAEEPDARVVSSAVDGAGGSARIGPGQPFSP